MKKLLYLLLLIPLGFVSSCDDDDNDYPYMEVTAVVNNVYYSGTDIYILDGQDLEIQEVDVKSLNGQPGGIANMYYMLNGNQCSLPQVVPPYSFTIDSGNIPSGKNYFIMFFDIYQKDRQPATSSMAYNLIKVKDASELPEGAKPGPVNLGPLIIGHN